MAFDKQRTLEIKITSDIGPAQASFDNLQAVLANTGVALTKLDTQIKTDANNLDTYYHKIQLTAASFAKLVEAQKQIGLVLPGKVLNKSDVAQGAEEKRTTPTTTYTGDVNATLALIEKQRKQLADAFARQTTTALSQQQTTLNTQQAARTLTGTDQLAATNAAREVGIKRRLRDDLAAIEKQIADGSIASMQAATSQRVALVARATREIIALQRQVESAQRAETNRQTSGNVFAVATKDRLATLQQQLTLEQAIRVNGANNIKTLEIKSAQEQLAIRQKLIADLTALENRLRTDTTTNRLQLMSQVTSQREALLLNAKNQLTQNSIALEQKQKAAIQESIQAHGNLALKVGEMVGIYRAWLLVLNTISNSIRAVPQIGIQLEATTASLTSTMNGATGANTALKALYKEADRTGISIDALRTSFRTFQASTSLAGESLESTWHMFTNINTVATALHLTTDQTNGVFLALAQIFNKTKVQSEELVKQLGNLLPGAFASFAAANRDMFKDSADLVAKMKLGVVTAHETVEKFTTFLSERFQASFNVAALGLNANIGRMQTSFTKLGETIYGTTRGPMLDFVKGITSINEWIVKDINGANQLGETMKFLGNVALATAGAALLNFVVNLTKAEVGFAALNAVILRNPFVFVAASVGTLALQFLTLKSNSEAAMKGIEEYIAAINKIPEKPTAVQQLQLDINSNPQVEEGKRQLAAIDKIITDTQAKLGGLKRTRDIAEKQGSDVASFYYDAQIAELEKQVPDLVNKRVAIEMQVAREIDKAYIEITTKSANIQAEALAAKEEKRLALRKAALMREGSPESLKKADEITLEQQFAESKADADSVIKRFEKQQEDIRKGLESYYDSHGNPIIQVTKEQYEKAKEDLKNYNYLLENGMTNTKNLEKAALREGNQTVVQNILNDIETAKQSTTTGLDIIDKKYKANLISFRQYVKDKLELQQGLAESEQSLNAELAGEYSRQGDTSKASEFTSKSNEAEKSKAEIEKASKLELIRLEEDYANSIEEVEGKIAQAQGKEEQYFRLKERARNADLRAQTELLALAGDPQAIGDLNKLRLLEAQTEAAGKLKDIQENLALAQEQYNAKMNQTNILVNLNIIGKTRALFIQKEDNEKMLEALRVEIELAKAAEAESSSKDKNGTIGEKQKLKIKAMEAEYQKLSLTSDAVASHIETTFSNAFENSFSALVQGTQTGKQAFASFVNSVVGEISKLIASEVQSAVLHPLLKGAIGGIGSLFGGGSAETALPNGVTSSISSYLSSGLSFAANGDSFSGAGISQYSGQLIDRPTVFPFAKGGSVGLMGEAGSEFVMPTARLPNGKLGVLAQGEKDSGKATTVVHSPTFVFNGRTDASPDEIGRQAAESYIRSIAKQEIYNAARAGNKLNQLTKV